jgi:hypothetical protein
MRHLPPSVLLLSASFWAQIPPLPGPVVTEHNLCAPYVSALETPFLERMHQNSKRLTTSTMLNEQQLRPCLEKSDIMRCRSTNGVKSEQKLVCTKKTITIQKGGRNEGRQEITCLNQTFGRCCGLLVMCPFSIRSPKATHFGSKAPPAPLVAKSQVFKAF